MSTLKNRIIELRNKGYLYSRISKELNCSIGTICYYVGKNQKEKNKLRARKRRNTNPLSCKLAEFKHNRIKDNSSKKHACDIKELICFKISKFHRGKTKGVFRMKDANFTVEDVIAKIGENPKCYLTGDMIDINSPRTYHFDHIIPRSRGGTNTLDNLGICTKRANLSKNDMTKDEYIEHCKKVLLHNGYKVEIDNASSI